MDIKMILESIKDDIHNRINARDQSLKEENNNESQHYLLKGAIAGLKSALLSIPTPETLNIKWTEEGSTKKVQLKICNKCGSDNIFSIAHVVWDFINQRWEVDELWDEGAYCNICEDPCEIETIEY